MKWPPNFTLFKKRTQEEVDYEYDNEPAGLASPALGDEMPVKPKRRSVSTDCSSRISAERKSSIEQWHEARRLRNSIDAPNTTVTTDKLNICRAGRTTIVNKTYMTVKQLGAGTFGQVMLCFNLVDRKLYAMKVCRKSKFGQALLRNTIDRRQRRYGGLGSPATNTSFGQGLSSGFGSSTSGTISSTTSSIPAPPAWGPMPSTIAGFAQMHVTPEAQAQSGAAPAATPCAGSIPESGEKEERASAQGEQQLNAPPQHRASLNQMQEAMMRFRTDEVVKEVAILKKLVHPNIVNLVEVIDDPCRDTLLLVMEYVEGRTLEPRRISADCWEPIKEREIWYYVREVLQGLDYLHYNHVVHGDLKPANLLIDSNTGKIKIVDFGSSIRAGEDLKSFGGLASTAFSTPAFRSPESLLSGYQLSYEMDMWALGVCIYQWTFGELPFTGAAPFIIYEKIRVQDITIQGNHISPELKDLLQGLLSKDVMERLDIQSAMAHPWVTQNGATPLVSLSAPDGTSARAGERCAIEVTREDLASAIRTNDAEEGMCELMDNVFNEIHLVEGERLVCMGDLANKIYLVASGEVEIYRDVSDGSSTSNQPIISGADVELNGRNSEDFLAMSGGSSLSGGSEDASDLSQVNVNWDLDSARRGSSNSSRTSSSKIIAVKGPGESLGLSCLSTNPAEAPVWRAAVRARTPATIFVADTTSLQKLIKRHPELEAPVQSIVVQQQTDLLVAEAIRQINFFSMESHHSKTAGSSKIRS